MDTGTPSANGLLVMHKISRGKEESQLDSEHSLLQHYTVQNVTIHHASHF